MESKASRILKQVLIENRGKQLTVKEIIELSKHVDCAQNSTFYSKNGISESFVHNQLVNYHNKWVDLIQDPFRKLVSNIVWNDGEIEIIRVHENSDKKSSSYRVE